MNKTPEETIALINGLKPLVADAKAEVVVCPPFVCLPAAVEAVKGSNIQEIGRASCRERVYVLV